MAEAVTTERSAKARARAWRHGFHAAVCETIEPWAHGTVVRASRYPTYYDLNVVRVEQEPGLAVDEIEAVADEALSGLAHRRLDFEDIDAGERRRAELTARGWKTSSLLWMRHEQPLPESDAGLIVEEAPYEAADELRLLWRREEEDGSEYEQFRVAAREVSLTRGVRVLSVAEAGRPIAFAQLERMGSGAEVTQVYVHPDRRNRGIGTALTCAAVRAVADAQDVWIVADYEDQAKELYRRLGFRPAWRSLECLLLR
jgi:ribosomal protein S18 acetylase RimI-like enzyme